MEAAALNIFKSAIEMVPTYDGNPNQLYRYLDTAGTVLIQFYIPENPDCFQNQLVLNSILGKLRGKAEEVVNINGATTWEVVKGVLLQHFSDQRDENSLTRDLVNMKQDNDDPQSFYNRCMHILNTIINYVNLHENNDTVKECKRNFFRSQCLKTFLAGLREPLGSTIRAMRPNDMPSALQYIKEEENISYLRKNNITVQQQQNKNNFPQNKQNLNMFRRPLPTFNSTQHNFNRQSNFSNQTRPIGQFNLRPPQLVNNYQPRPFQLRPDQHSSGIMRASQPQPMSGISYRSANRPPFVQNRSYQPNSNPNLSLHAQETTSVYGDDYYCTDYNQDNYYDGYYDENTYSNEYYNQIPLQPSRYADITEPISEQNTQFNEVGISAPQTEQNFHEVLKSKNPP